MKIMCQKCGHEVGEIHGDDEFESMDSENQDKAIEKEMGKGGGKLKEYD